MKSYKKLGGVYNMLQKIKRKEKPRPFISPAPPFFIDRRKGRKSDRMTRKEAIEHNKNLKKYMRFSDKTQPCKFREENYIALDMAIRSLEIDEQYGLLFEGKPNKWDRLYKWLCDMRFGIAPDETTPEDERGERQAQVDVLDDIMAWIVKEA